MKILVESENSTNANSTIKISSDLIPKVDSESREKELRMENLAKFKSIKKMNDRFRNFVTSFQENEKVISQKFKHAKILNDDGHLEKDLDLKVPINSTETATTKPITSQLIEIDSPTGSKSARNLIEITPIFEQSSFATEGNNTSRNKALSGDLKSDSFTGLSEDEEIEPKLEITYIEKFINEIGYKH